MVSTNNSYKFCVQVKKRRKLFRPEDDFLDTPEKEPSSPGLYQYGKIDFMYRGRWGRRHYALY